MPRLKTRWMNKEFNIYIVLCFRCELNKPQFFWPSFSFEFHSKMNNLNLLNLTLINWEYWNFVSSEWHMLKLNIWIKNCFNQSSFNSFRCAAVCNLSFYCNFARASYCDLGKLCYTTKTVKFANQMTHYNQKLIIYNNNYAAAYFQRLSLSEKVG